MLWANQDTLKKDGIRQVRRSRTLLSALAVLSIQVCVFPRAVKGKNQHVHNEGGNDIAMLRDESNKNCPVPSDNETFYESTISKRDLYPHNDFTFIPLEELNIAPITWADTGKVVTKNALEVRIPDSVTKMLLKYCEQNGITEKFRELATPKGSMEVSTDSFHTFGNENYPMKWFIQRPEEHWNSNMHWISPADEASHEDFLRVLGEGGFDNVLETIGEYLNLDGLVCFQLTFMGVSECGDGYMHHDFTETDDKAFNVIIPLILADDSPPELYLQDEEEVIEGTDEPLVGAYKYRLGAGAIMGDDSKHSTARVDYLRQGQFRLAATVYIADVNPDNVAGVISDYTQHFPPHDEDYLLERAGKHWRPRRMLPRGPQSLEQ